MGQLEQKTDYEFFKISLKFATDDELSSGTRSFYKTHMGKIVQEVDKELTGVLGQDWTTLKGQNQGMIAIHTVLVLWRTIREGNYESLSSEEQNQLKWAALLHQISKRGSPTILGRDHCHAFKSAESTIRILMRLGLIESVT